MKISKNRRFLKAFLLFLGAATAFVILEIFIRLFLPPPPIITIKNLHEKEPNHPPSMEIFGRVDNDLNYMTQTGIRVKGNVRAQVINHFLSGLNVDISTNSYGFRYRQLATKTATEFRILALGDSITIQDYLPEEQTYTHYLENLLNQDKTSPNKNFEVINAGVGAIESENELAILMENGLKIKPDVVFLELFLNDAYRSESINLIKPPQIATYSQLINFIVNEINLIRAKNHSLTFHEIQPQQELPQFTKQNPPSDEPWQTSNSGFNKLIEQNFNDWGYAYSPNFAPKISHVMAVFKQVAKQNNFRFVVVMFPAKYQVEADILRNEPQIAIAKTMQEQNISFFDLLPSLRQKYQKDKVDLFYDQAHPKAEGNEFIAGQAAKFLQNSVLPN